MNCDFYNDCSKDDLIDIILVGHLEKEILLRIIKKNIIKDY